MIEHYKVYCDGKVVYEVESPHEYPFPFNMALDAALKHLSIKPSGITAMILDDSNRLIGVAVHTSYTPCPWTIKREIIGGDGG